MAKYVKFQLLPGQSPPSDGKCWGIIIPNTDWLVWVGEDSDTFPNPSLTYADMTQGEIDSVQPQALCKSAAKDFLDRQLDSQQALIRALALTILDEVNTLRDLHSLAARTKAQLITAIKNKLDSGDATT